MATASNITAVRSSWSYLTLGTTALSLYLCFSGKVPHLIALGILALGWGVRWACSATFRQDAAAWRTRLWQTCQADSIRHGVVPWRAAALLVVMPAGLFFLANNFVSEGDNVPVMLAATSVVSEGNWDLSEFADHPDKYPYVGAVQRNERGVFSSYPSGPVQFAVPVALVCKLVGGDLHHPNVLRRLHKWTSAWLAAASLGLFFLTCLHFVDATAAWITTMLLATGSVMFSTISQGLWQHGGIVFWAQLYVLLEFQQTARPRRWTIWIQGLALGFMMSCRLSAALVIGPLVIWSLVNDLRRGLLLPLLAGLFYLPWACLYLTNYGQPFGPSTGQLGSFSWRWDLYLASFAGVFVSPGRGFLVYQLWAILALGTLLGMGRRQADDGVCPKGWQLAILVAFALNVAMVSVWPMWWGGWCWGSRLLADTTMLFALLCARPVAELWRHVWGRRLIVGIAIFGFLVHAPDVYLGAERWNGVPGDIDQQPQRLWSWQKAPFLHPLNRFSGK